MCYCKAHPDEKGTESELIAIVSRPKETQIARPIPMKRELKGQPDSARPSQKLVNCKAHPDEKGTERITEMQCPPSRFPPYCKAHPDEKGTERLEPNLIPEVDMWYCKAHPDEKGTESIPICPRNAQAMRGIARPIPMKRELKVG